MPRYVTQGRYAARRDGQTYGPWEPDTVVTLEPTDAEWVNRDSPGVLVPEVPEPTMTTEIDTGDGWVDVTEDVSAEETESEPVTPDEGTDEVGAEDEGGAVETAAPAKVAKPRQNRKHTPSKARS